jgi:tRNA (cmo5U34)-methyltransferase
VTVGQAFNESVVSYDEWVKVALPDYEKIFAVAKELIPFAPDERIDVLDLGAGTGLFSQHVLDKYPHATFALYDVAVDMLNVARERFQGFPDQFQFTVDDYRHLQDLQRFDLVISSLSIHHLPDGDKRDVFRRIYAALRGNGLFINVDQVKGPTAYFQELYWTNWLDKVRERGGTEDRIRESVQRRIAYDRDALLTDQLQWLGEAGCVNVDCVYKNYFVGVFVATKG